MPSLSNEHFDLYSAFHVPESHSWSSSYLHDHPVVDVASATIPIIDISSPNAASSIGAACRSWGAFYATNHGVPTELLDRVESHARQLFSLPLNRKLLTSRQDGSHSGFGRPPLSSFFPKLMWSEGFTIAGADPKDLTSTLFPSSFCDVMEQYKNAMRKTASKLMKLILLSLGLNQEEIGQLKISESAEFIQLNSYPACPEPNRAIGMAAHTDSAFLTLLHQSNIDRGLQILHYEDGFGLGSARWVPVPHIYETLVVNVGDLLHIFSNGQLKNVRHRAAVSRAGHRVSAAYFFGPPGDIEVGPVEKLVDPIRGPIYRPVTWPEYLEMRRRFFDKALELVKLQEEGLERRN